MQAAYRPGGRSQPRVSRQCRHSDLQLVVQLWAEVEPQLGHGAYTGEDLEEPLDQGAREGLRRRKVAALRSRYERFRVLVDLVTVDVRQQAQRWRQRLQPDVGQADLVVVGRFPGRRRQQAQDR